MWSHPLSKHWLARWSRYYPATCLRAAQAGRVKILDGNCLEATEHRIHELRGTAAGPLPGKSLVVLDPSLKLMVDVR